MFCVKRGLIGVSKAGVLNDFPYQRVAVGVDARGRQSNEDVAVLEVFAGDGLALGQPAERRAREVEFGDDARERGGLPAGERDSSQPARFGQRCTERGMDGRVGSWDGDVVNKGDRFCTDAQQVVDVHGHAVNAHAAPLFQQGGDLQFAAHTVGRHGEQVVAELDEAAKATGQIDRCPGGPGLSHAR